MGKTEKIIIIVTSVILAAIIGVAIYMTVDKAIAEDSNFDYVKSDLSKYVSFSEKEYKNYEIEIDIAKPRDIDPDDAILSLLASKKGSVLNDGAAVTSPVTIKAGDVVYIWIRGYLLDNENNKVYLPGMTNFSGDESRAIEIGSGELVPGFELSLVGKNTGDYPKFTKIKEGTVKNGQVAYVSYSRLVEGGDEKKDKTTGHSVRIDLADETVDETFGKGFKENILGAKIGEAIGFDVTLDGKKHTYSATSVDFVTECEVSPLVIECYFPYDYDTVNLRNETAYFEVYIEKVQQYESPEFNDDFVLEIINDEESEVTLDMLNEEVTLDMLNEYEGDSLTEKLRAYIEASIYEEYEAIYDEKVAKAVWEKCLLDADVKRYPGKIVDEVYRGYEADVYQKYNETGGSIKNSYTEEYEHFEDVDSFAMAYLSLGYSKYDDWKEYLYDMSKSLVKERLVMHYLIQNEGLRLTDEEYAAQYEITYQETLDLYMELYYEKNGTSRKDYTDEEYEALVAEGVEQLKLLNKDYFPETIYYDILMNEMIKWPKVSTLDDRRAYNFE